MPFLGDGFIRVTDEEEGLMSNTYYGWECVASIRTLGASNGNSEEDKRKAIADQFISIGRDIEIEIMPSGTYRLTPDASTETLQIEFFI